MLVFSKSDISTEESLSHGEDEEEDDEDEEDDSDEVSLLDEEEEDSLRRRFLSDGMTSACDMTYVRKAKERRLGLLSQLVFIVPTSIESRTVSCRVERVHQQFPDQECLIRRPNK